MSNGRSFRRKVSDVARADQLGAARRETTSLVSGLAAHWACQPSTVLVRWAMRLIADRSARLDDRDPTLAVCGHVQAPAALLMPTWCDVVVCTGCLDLIPLAQGDDDRRCDGCLEVVDRIHPTAMAAPTAIVLGGLCGGCLETTKVRGAA